MPSLNFMEQFADDVESGQKLQSIRATNRFKVGDTVYLYTGMRQKGCRKLGEGIVTEVYPIKIESDTFGICNRKRFQFGKCAKRSFAKKDGFTNWAAMRDWFSKTHGLPFRGWLIKWRKTK